MNLVNPILFRLMFFSYLFVDALLILGIISLVIPGHTPQSVQAQGASPSPRFVTPTAPGSTSNAAYKDVSGNVNVSGNVVIVPDASPGASPRGFTGSATSSSLKLIPLSNNYWQVNALNGITIYDQSAPPGVRKGSLLYDASGYFGLASSDNAWKVQVNTSGVNLYGNVGIGTTTPGALLDIAGANSGSLYVGNGSAGALQLVGNNGTGNAYINNANTVGGQLDLQTRGATRLSITSAGNVGIGTSTPGDKLDVNGSIRVAAGSVLRMTGVGESDSIFAESPAGAINGKTRLVFQTSDDNAYDQGWEFRSAHWGGSTTSRMYIPGDGSAVDIRAGLSLTGAVRFDCPACGGVNSLEAGGDWGDMTIQGRVLSANGSIHLSPSAGSNVQIDSAYRAAGGATGTVGICLNGSCITSWPTGGGGGTGPAGPPGPQGPAGIDAGTNETLQSVTNRGSTTTNSISAVNLTANSNGVVWGNLSVGSNNVAWGGGEVNANHLYITANDSWFPYPGNGYNYIRGNSYMNGTLYDEDNINYSINPASYSTLWTLTVQDLSAYAITVHDYARFYSDATFQGYVVFNGGKSGYVIDIAQNDSGSNLEQGDVVTLSKNDSTVYSVGEIPTLKVRKATGSDSGKPLWIVDKLARLKQSDNSYEFIAATIEPGQNLALVTLGSYKQVKVNSEGGKIVAGSPLSASSIPGVASKATRPGMILGYALESLNSDSGTVKVFYSPSSYFDTDTYLTSTDGSTISSILEGGQRKFQVKDKAGNIINRIGQFAESVIGSLKAGLIETQKLIVGGVDVTEKLNQQDKMIQNQQQEIDQLKITVEELRQSH